MSNPIHTEKLTVQHVVRYPDREIVTIGSYPPYSGTELRIVVTDDEMLGIFHPGDDYQVTATKI